MNRKIDLNNLKTYLEACENIGEKGVVNILKNLIKKDKETIKDFIINEACLEFKIDYNELISKGSYSKKNCLIAIVHLIKKYLNYSTKDLCFLLKLKRIRLHIINKEYNELNPNIKSHKEILDKVKIIEQNLLNYLKN